MCAWFARWPWCAAVVLVSAPGHACMQLCTPNGVYIHTWWLPSQMVFVCWQHAGIYRQISASWHAYAESCESDAPHGLWKPLPHRKIEHALEKCLVRRKLGRASTPHRRTMAQPVIYIRHHLCADPTPTDGQVDVWSAGVLLYVMLAGYAPFNGSTNEAIFESIVGDPLNLKSKPWPDISPAAKVGMCLHWRAEHRAPNSH